MMLNEKNDNEDKSVEGNKFQGLEENGIGLAFLAFPVGILFYLLFICASSFETKLLISEFCAFIFSLSAVKLSFVFYKNKANTIGKYRCIFASIMVFVLVMAIPASILSVTVNHGIERNQIKADNELMKQFVSSSPLTYDSNIRSLDGETKFVIGYKDKQYYVLQETSKGYMLKRFNEWNTYIKEVDSGYKISEEYSYVVVDKYKDRSNPSMVDNFMFKNNDNDIKRNTINIDGEDSFDDNGRFFFNKKVYRAYFEDTRVQQTIESMDILESKSVYVTDEPQITLYVPKGYVLEQFELSDAN